MFTESQLQSANRRGCRVVAERKSVNSSVGVRRKTIVLSMRDSGTGGYRETTWGYDASRVCGGSRLGGSMGTAQWAQLVTLGVWLVKAFNLIFQCVVLLVQPGLRRLGEAGVSHPGFCEVYGRFRVNRRSVRAQEGKEGKEGKEAGVQKGQVSLQTDLPRETISVLR